MHKTLLNTLYYFSFVTTLTLASLVSMNAHADSIIYSFDTTFNGTSPSGNTPFMTATLNQIAGNPNAVSLTFSTAGLVNGPGQNQFVDSVYMNFISPTQNATNLNFAVSSSPNSVSAPSAILTPGQTQKADGTGGFFNVQLDFQQGNNPNPGRFIANNSITLQVSSNIQPNTPSMSVYDFFAQAIDSGYYIAAHIQGMGGGRSGWITATPTVITVPEPSTYILLASLLTISVWLASRRRYITSAAKAANSDRSVFSRKT